jgi:CheY-like chemotaxis protein
LSPLILVVESHDDTRLLLRLVAEMQGCRVAEALNGAECVRMLEEMKPAMILMDTDLPQVDGLTATASIRSRPHLNDVPIVCMSGQAQAEYRRRAFAAGVNEYLVKPISLEDLEAAISRNNRGAK